MKKILVLGLFLVLGFSQFSKAEEAMATVAEPYYNGWYVQPQLAAFIPTEDKLDNGLYLGLKGGYQWNEWLSFEAETGYVGLDFHNDDAEISIVPLLFGLRWNVLVDDVFEPYVYGALGVALNDASGAGQNLDNSVAVVFGGGFEYYFNASTSCFVDLRGFLTKPEWDTRYLDSPDVEVNAVSIGAGVNFRF